MSSGPRRHHTVPRFYFRGFSKSYGAGKKTKDARFTSAVRLTDRRRVPRLSIKDAALEVDFYRIAELDDPVVFEKTLSEIEAAAAPVIRRVCESKVWPLRLADRTALAEFMAIQHLRGRGARDEMVQLRDLFGGVIGAAEQRKMSEGRSTKEEVEALIAEYMNSEANSVKAVEHVDQILLLYRAVREHVVAASWHLVRFPKGSLLTSDQPLSLVGHPDAKPNAGLGLGSALAYLFPLSRDTGLLMNNHSDAAVRQQSALGVFDSVLPDTRDRSEFFNTHTLLGAFEWVFAHPEDTHLIPSDAELPARPVVRLRYEILHMPSASTE